MKRKVFSAMAIAAVALVSCKKEDVNSTELGSATINGNVWAHLDESNDVDGSGNYIPDLNPEGIEGMQVSIEVDTYYWDQNPNGSYNYDKKTYTTTTDANGDWTLTIPATDDGYNVTIEYGDIYTTRTRFSNSGALVTEDVRVFNGNNSEFIFNGANITLKDEASISTINNTAEEYSTAMIYGTIYIQSDITPDDPGYETAGETPNTDIMNQMLKMSWGQAPHDYSYDNIYDITINADGTYSAEVVTNALGEGSVWVYVGYQDWVGTQTRSNVGFTADSTWQVVYTTYGIDNYGSNWLEAGSIDTGVDVYVDYNQF